MSKIFSIVETKIPGTQNLTTPSNHTIPTIPTNPTTPINPPPRRKKKRFFCKFL